jgi:TalC/MipB family fructose-6-phosphate aldolase
MKFFIDTANLAQIKEAHDLGILDGVTTNPSLMAKEGIKGEDAVMQHYLTICELVDGDVSAEVLGTEVDGIIEEGKKLAAIHPNIVVKVPMIKDGVKALKWFSDNGIKTNCTLVFSAGQAILAAKAGANYVSPFIGRIDDGINAHLRDIFSYNKKWHGFSFRKMLLDEAEFFQSTTNSAICAGQSPCDFVDRFSLFKVRNKQFLFFRLPEMTALRKTSEIFKQAFDIIEYKCLCLS